MTHNFIPSFNFRRNPQFSAEFSARGLFAFLLFCNSKLNTHTFLPGGD